MSIFDFLKGSVTDDTKDYKIRTIFNPYLLWKEDYISIEKEFINFIQYVPLTVEHYNMWSLRLANLLLLIGSSIDSFFKCLISSLRRDLVYNHIESPKFDYVCVKIDNKWECVFYQGIGYTIEDYKEESNFYKILLKNTDESNKNPNMGLYRTIFEEYYKLSSKSVYVLRNKEKIKPFAEWSDGKSPNWWLVYRDLKHSRFEYRKLATLKTVLDALSALFLLNIYNTNSRKFLITEGVILSNINLNQEPFLTSRETLHTLEPIIAKSKLFGYVWDTTGPWNKYPWKILNSDNVYDL